MNDWIGVEEWLPEPDSEGTPKIVLVWCNDDYEFAHIEKLNEDGKAVWHVWGGESPILEINHWMPLPEPPK